MKYILLILVFSATLFGGIIKSKILSLNEEKTEATIKVKNIDVGVNGFIVHNIEGEHNIILSNTVVTSYDKQTQIATLKLSEYNSLVNNALPSGNWQVSLQDYAVLAFGYTRALLIAPNETMYYKIIKHYTNF